MLFISSVSVEKHSGDFGDTSVVKTYLFALAFSSKFLDATASKLISFLSHVCTVALLWAEFYFYFHLKCFEPSLNITTPSSSCYCVKLMFSIMMSALLYVSQRLQSVVMECF